NPLYAEEHVRLVRDRGLRPVEGELPLPETVQGIVAARVDALPPAEKALLQAAAVIGKVGWPAALAAVSGEPPERVLEGGTPAGRRASLRGERPSSVAGEPQFGFRHALLREVAYGQVTRARRAEAHRRCAAWLEGLEPGRVEGPAARLAFHYAAALA